MSYRSMKARGIKAFFARTAALLMMLVVFAASAVNVRAETKIEKPVNFVLLLDCSGSMWGRNDPENMTRDSAKMFVDKLQHENTNLAIIVFGCDYGSEAFDIGSDDPESRNRVKVAFPLQDISSVEARGEAKNVIGKETDRREDGTMTPLGYALQAANSVLEEAETDINHAAIILLSDGQVDGQTDGYNVDAKGIAHDYDSVDDATETAAKNKWPIYAMELNFKGENKEGDGRPGVGYHIMREKIPESAGTDPLELTNSEQARELFDKILAKFYGITIPPDKPTKLNDPYSFHVDDLTVESTISITGDINEVKGLTLDSPSKKTKMDVSLGTENTQDHILSVEGTYIVLTIFQPEVGDWKLTLEGKGKYEYKLSLISLQESNLQLHATEEDGSQIKRGTKVDFTASYIYQDRQFESDTFYKNHPAKLWIKGIEPVEMEANEYNYHASYTFDKAGTYEVYVRVEGDMFRQGYKDSGVFTFAVENQAPVAVGSIQNQSVDVGKDLPTFNLEEHFSDPEGDALEYSLEAPAESGMKGTVTTDGIMTIKAGKRGGEFDVKAVASDGSSTAEIPFKITVNQHPFELKVGKKLDIELIINDPARETKEVRWDDLFMDPDGSLPDVAIDEESCKGVSKTDVIGGVSFAAVGKGSAKYTVRAVDKNDPSITDSVTIHVSSKTKLGAFLDRFKPFILGLVAIFAIVAAVYGAAFKGRYTNYGFWDINGQPDIPISNYSAAKKASFKLDDLLRDLGEPDGFGNVRISAGNKINKKVFIENLDQVAVAVIGGTDINDMDGNTGKSRKKMEFKRGMEIRLENEGEAVTLYRHYKNHK